MSSKALLDFAAEVTLRSSKIKNYIPAEFVVLPSNVFWGLDRENLTKYRCINNPRLYDITILDKYKDKILGHAMNSSAQDVILLQYDKYNHFQLLMAVHPEDNTIPGFKVLFYTKGGDEYEQFVNNNQHLEKRPYEGTIGFGR
jgi:hypothetical protein